MARGRHVDLYWTQAAMCAKVSTVDPIARPRPSMISTGASQKSVLFFR